MKFSDNTTLTSIFEEQARRHAAREFVVYPDSGLRYTYGEARERIDRLARGLLALGIRKGDHVGIWATNVPDWVTYLFAIAKTGAILVPLNISYKATELRYVLKQSDMKALVLARGFKDVDYIETVCQLLPPLRAREGGEIRSDEFPRLRHAIFMGENPPHGMRTTAELFELGRGIPDSALAGAAAGQTGSDVVNIQYTSGTTGFPKGVMLTHRNLIDNGYSLGQGQNYSEAERLCLAVPLFHCFGIVLGVLAIVTHGASMAILETFTPLETLRAVETEKCTALHGVPAMFIAMLSHPEFERFNLHSLRTGIMAGAPCPREIMRRVVSEMHCADMTIGYGLTEAAPGITQTRLDAPLEQRVSTVGTPLPGLEVKIVDPESGKALGAGKPGELCCRGYNVMKGYYNMPEATALAIDADGWLHTGDQATLDEDGCYRITGRIKDMIIQGGENISPREIEELLYTMPGIKEVQVVGVPNARLGEVPAAVIVPQDGAAPSPRAIRAFCRNRLARFKIPKHIFFVDHYPVTASGKVQKYKLREMIREKLGIDHGIFEDSRE